VSKLLLNTEDVSRILNVSKTTIKRWTDDGKLRCIRTPGGHRKFTLSNIQEFERQYQFFGPVDSSEQNHL